MITKVSITRKKRMITLIVLTLISIPTIAYFNRSYLLTCSKTSDPYWVNGTSYPSRVSTRQSRKTLHVVWRGSTTGGGIAQNTDWRKVSLERYIHV